MTRHFGLPDTSGVLQASAPLIALQDPIAACGRSASVLSSYVPPITVPKPSDWFAAAVLVSLDAIASSTEVHNAARPEWT